MQMTAYNFSATDAVAVRFPCGSIYYWRQRIIAVRHEEMFYRCDAREDGILYRRIREAYISAANDKTRIVSDAELRSKATQVVIEAASLAVAEIITQEN